MVIHDLKHPNESLSASLTIFKQNVIQIEKKLEQLEQVCNGLNEQSMGKLTDLGKQLKDSMLIDDDDEIDLDIDDNFESC